MQHKPTQNIETARIMMMLVNNSKIAGLPAPVGAVVASRVSNDVVTGTPGADGE
jgi:hypothetical protein